MYNDAPLGHCRGGFFAPLWQQRGVLYVVRVRIHTYICTYIYTYKTYGDGM